MKSVSFKFHLHDRSKVAELGLASPDVYQSDRKEPI